MAKYREGDEVVDAFRWSAGPDPDWLAELAAEGKLAIGRAGTNQAFLMVITPEGDFRMDVGDYIVKKADGSVFPCEAEVFEMVYERIEDAD